MATITKPPILDETGQDIVTKLNNINTQVTALNALIADLGLVSITPISQADYDNLSPTDKLNGVFDIYDAVEPQIDGDSVSYDSNTTIKQAVDNVVKVYDDTAVFGSYSSFSLTGSYQNIISIVAINDFVVFAHYGNKQSGSSVYGKAYTCTSSGISAVSSSTPSVAVKVYCKG